MRRQLNYFSKGIDVRVSDTSGDETRFRRLENVRLNKRGKTGSITRMGGYKPIYTNQDYQDGDIFHDSIFFGKYYIILWYDISMGKVYLNIIDTTTEALEQIGVADENVEYSELQLVDKYIYISAFEKILNRDGTGWLLSDFKSTTPIINVEDSIEAGALEQNENYWYKARFIYDDGHVTKSSYPTHIYTGANTSIEINISQIPLDLNGEYVDVEIFRRRDTEDYYLIGRKRTNSTTFQYIDKGDPKLTLLREENYVWADSSRTHEIVRDRIVKANNEYGGIENDSEFGVELVTTVINSGEQGLPYNTDVEVYSQVRKVDGTETIFKHQDTVSTISTLPFTSDKKLRLTQTGEYSGDFKEGAIFARFRPNPSSDSIKFNSLEIYNSKVPSMVTDGEELEDKPLNPHIFLGWKYVTKWEQEPLIARIYDKEWNTDPEAHSVTKNRFLSQLTPLSPPLSPYSVTHNTRTIPFIASSLSSNIGQFMEYSKRAQNGDVPQVEFNVRDNPYSNGTVSFTLDGQTIPIQITYVNYASEILAAINGQTVVPLTLKIVGGVWEFTSTLANANKEITFNNGGTGLLFNSGTSNNQTTTFTLTKANSSAIYQIAFLQALEEAIRQGTAKLRLVGVSEEVKYLSTVKETNEFIGTEVKIIGIVDTSERDSESILNTGGLLFSGEHNHIYLVLEAGSVFDDFDNKNANNSGVMVRYKDEIPNLSHRYRFEIMGLKGLDTKEYTIDDTKFWDEDIDYDYRLTLTDYTHYNNDAAVLIQEFDTQTLNTPQITEMQGWEKEIINKYEHFKINTWNEYSSVITEDDIKQFKSKYPNQIIWGGSFAPESNISRTRNFDFTNFKHISGLYGEILSIKYIQGKLLVFCENGVSSVNVGEILTRQTSGQTYVDSSVLLNDDYWVLENLQRVQPKSIIQQENMLFFCDGYDVWIFDGQFRNITSGKIVIDPKNEYIGAYDPRNKEYLLSDHKGTYSFSLELGEWSGKHTFKLRTARAYNNNYYGIAQNNSFVEAVRFNAGNMYGLEKYDSVVESVGMYFENPSYMKRFRKIYLDTGLMQSGNYNAFTNGFDEDFDSWESVRLSYSNDGHNYSNIQTYSQKVANGMIEVGIKGGYSRGYYLFWRLETEDPEFTLYSIGYNWNLNYRR